jgi:hypothetical protein
MRSAHWLALLCLGSSCADSSGVGTGDVLFDEAFELDEGEEGFVGGFADYPAEDEAIYELSFGWAPLPAEVGPGGGLAIAGNNHSDDLFMYVARAVTGLPPEAAVHVDLEIRIATNAPSDCFGIGGAPGTSVYMKAGAVAAAPSRSLDEDGFFRMDLDKGNQASEGEDMLVLGDIGNELECPDETYAPKTFSLEAFAVRTSATGSLHVVIGTDSGFEGTTALFYDRVAIRITAAE